MSIYKKIPAIMAEVGHIAKTRKNQGQGYSFRGIDDFYLAVQPLFAKHGVFVAPSVINEAREERASKSGGVMIYSILRVVFTFWADDGTYFTCTTVGEAMDSGDKSANKAMSAAMKYALMQVFCVPTEEDNDTENNSPDPIPKFPTAEKITVNNNPEGFATEPQIKRLTALQLKSMVPDSVLKTMAAGMGITSRNEIPKAKYNLLCSLVENYKA